MEEKRKAYKDYFDASAATMLVSQVQTVHAEFPRKRFITVATKDIQQLEFAARVKQYSDALRLCLPDDVPQALKILRDSLPPALPDCKAVTDGWLQWPVGQFVADNGLDHFEDSFTTMIELTQRFSSEFAVRPFVEHYPERTFKALAKLTGHRSPHVRRWCSEGVRSRLPWGKKLRALVQDATPIWPLLQALRDDPELYVRRSVANNLNDISKDHPEQLIQHLKKWSVGASAQRQWVISHGLRSLVKNGDPKALQLVGYAAPKSIDARLKLKPSKLEIGASLTIQATLVNNSSTSQKLLVDFCVHYLRKSGQHNGKVFKWTSLELGAGERVEISKSQPFRVTTVRALYLGKHRVELQINGIVLAKSSFQLQA